MGPAFQCKLCLLKHSTQSPIGLSKESIKIIHSKRIEKRQTNNKKKEKWKELEDRRERKKGGREIEKNKDVYSNNNELYLTCKERKVSFYI